MRVVSAVRVFHLSTLVAKSYSAFSALRTSRIASILAISVLCLGIEFLFKIAGRQTSKTPDEVSTPPLPAGRVLAANRSHQLVKIASRSWTDGDGKAITRKITWVLEPGESLPLQLDDRDLLARSFAYTCTTTHGSKDLSTEYADGDVLLVDITDEQVAKTPPPPAPASLPSPVVPPHPPVVEASTIKFEPKIEIASPPPKRSADIIIKSVTLSGTRPNGAAWDASGPPDPVVYIEQKKFLGSSYTTNVEHDSFSASFNEKSIRVSEGDTIKIIVYDKDVLDDDEVGTYVKTITAHTLNERNVDWSFGGVLSLLLEFQP